MATKRKKSARKCAPRPDELLNLSVEVLGYPLLMDSRTEIVSEETYRYFSGLLDGLRLRYVKRAPRTHWKRLVAAIEKRWPKWLPAEAVEADGYYAWRMKIL